MLATRHIARIRGRDGLRDFTVTVRQGEQLVDEVRERQMVDSIEVLERLGSVHASQHPQGARA